MSSPTISAISCWRWPRPSRSRIGSVTDKLEGQADQDRRESREPRPLYGRGRHPTANVPGDFAAHGETPVAATTSAGVRCSIVMFKSKKTRGARLYVRGNRQIRPSDAVWTVWHAGAIDTSHLAPANPENRLHPRSFGVHPGNPGSPVNRRSHGSQSSFVCLLLAHGNIARRPAAGRGGSGRGRPAHGIFINFSVLSL